MLKRRKKSNPRGSFTAEAALIMPLIIFVILALIFLIFYLCDRIKIQNILHEGLEKAVLQVKRPGSFDGEEIYFEHINDRGPLFFLTGSLEQEREELEGFLSAGLERGFYLAGPGILEIMLDHQRAGAEIVIRPNIPIPQVKKYFKRVPLIVKAQIGIHNPAEFVRIYTVLGEVVGKLGK